MINIRESLIWYLKDIIHNDGCKQCFSSYIVREVEKSNKDIENEVLYLLEKGDKEIKDMLYSIIINIPSWYFKNSTLIKIIEDEFNEDTRDINFKDLY